MKSIFLLLIFSGAQVSARNSETFDQLDAAFSEGHQQTALAPIFDGAARQEPTLVGTDNISPVRHDSAVTTRNIFPNSYVPTPIPTLADNESPEADMGFKATEFTAGEKLTANELKKVASALDLLGKTQNGVSAYSLYYREGVELRWSKGAYMALTPPPSEVAGLKIIWLNDALKESLTDQGFDQGVKTGLAIMLAHELRHEADYAQIDRCFTEYCGFMLEAGGYLSGMSLYHELRAKNMTPQINSVTDTVFLQEQRFYLDIWNYKHGGPKPDIKSYPQILKLKNSREPALQEIYKRTAKTISKLNPENNGVTAFAELIKVRYGYDALPGFWYSISSSLEDMQRYQLLFWSVYKLDKTYCAWRNNIGDPVLKPSPVYDPATYSPLTQQHLPAQSVEPPAQGGHQGNGAISGNSGGSNTHSGTGQPTTPNPTFPPHTWPTSGQ